MMDWYFIMAHAQCLSITPTLMPQACTKGQHVSTSLSMLAVLPYLLHCRYRKKVEKDEDYIRTVVQLGAAIENLVKQVLTGTHELISSAAATAAHTTAP